MAKIIRWNLAAAAVMFASGLFSMAHAAGEMDKVFNATTSGYYEEAVTMWQDLAAAGDAQAQFNLGLMYHGGLGLPRDESEAVKLYEMAAEGGYPAAQEYMVVGYEEGWFGLPQDSAKAYYWRGMLAQNQQ
jgi:TPR repeat protein